MLSSVLTFHGIGENFSYLVGTGRAQLVLCMDESRGVMLHQEMLWLYSRCSAFPKQHRAVLSILNVDKMKLSIFLRIKSCGCNICLIFGQLAGGRWCSAKFLSDLTQEMVLNLSSLCFALLILILSLDKGYGFH